MKQLTEIYTLTTYHLKQHLTYVQKQYIWIQLRHSLIFKFIVKKYFFSLIYLDKKASFKKWLNAKLSQKKSFNIYIRYLVFLTTTYSATTAIKGSIAI